MFERFRRERAACCDRYVRARRRAAEHALGWQSALLERPLDDDRAPWHVRLRAIAVAPGVARATPIHAWWTPARVGDLAKLIHNERALRVAVDAFLATHGAVPGSRDKAEGGHITLRVLKALARFRDHTEGMPGRWLVRNECLPAIAHSTIKEHMRHVVQAKLGPLKPAALKRPKPKPIPKPIPSWVPRARSESRLEPI